MSKKATISLFMAMLLILTACSTNQTINEKVEPQGAFKATEEGFGGNIEVSIELQENKIVKIDVVETETPTIGGEAIKKLKDEIIEKQSIAIDVVASATVSSTAFLKAVESALTLAGVKIEDFKKVVETNTNSTEIVKLSTDVVVVGAGGAGLTAAISSAQGKLDVILLEKMAMAGGASAMAGGGTLGTGSELQKSFGIEDTPEIVFMDLMKNGNFSNHANTTWLFANTAGKALDWLSSENGAGLKYKVSEPKPSAEHSVGRTFSPEGGGSGAIASLLQKAESLGVKVMYETPGVELISANGVVTGIKAEGKDGTTYEITAKSVILATGGYGANEELVSEEIRKLPYAGAVSATGDGLLMAQAIGADAINLNKVNIQPHSITLPDGRGQHTYQAALSMYRSTGSILISEKGERFVNEQGSGKSIKELTEEQERTYLIMDEESFATYAQTSINSKNFTQKQLDEWLAANGTMTPVFAKASSIEELAKIINVPGDKLQATVTRYNEFVANGEDLDFGRGVTKPMNTEGTYYAVEMNLRYYATLGGLRINDDMQVVTENDSPIVGLYAAGEVVGGALGDIYAPGALFGWAMTSGYNAGTSVVKNLTK